MAWTVIPLKPVQDWLLSLDKDSFARVAATIKLLEEMGHLLGTPYVKKIETSHHANMKELRIAHGNEHFRILFAFDKERSAILLAAGEKISFGVKEFYEHHVPKADALFDAHQLKLGQKDRSESTPRSKRGRNNGKRGTKR